MSHAMLISNNEIINSIYEVNLRVYVATNVTIKPDVKNALALLEHEPNLDAIICFRDLKKDSSYEELIHYLDEQRLKVPIIILGEPDHPVTNAIVIKNKYDIKSLMQAMATILEITAKQMAQRSVPQYFSCPIKLFEAIKEAPYDVYYRHRKEDFNYDYLKVIETGDNIAQKVQKYVDEGCEYLFIEADNRLRFINEASGILVKELEREDLSTSERVSITEKGMNLVAESLFENEEISEQVASISAACVKSMAQVAADVPKLKNLIALLLADKSDYVYFHSVLATFVATNIINNISWGSKEQSEKISFAFFFHDIYLVQFYKKYPDLKGSEEDLLFSDLVPEEEKRKIVEHAKLAGSLVSTFPRAPIGADMIITQHHGMMKGEGFASDFKDDISPLAKIMVVSEAITDSIMSNIEANGGKPPKKLVDKQALIPELEERFKRASYRKIIKAFDESPI